MSGPLEHLLIGLAVQVLCARLTGSWWLGAALATAFFLGREFTQAEYRAIEHFYDGRRAHAPWAAGFELRAWNLKSLLDWLAPALATGLLAGWRTRSAT
ncbi:MAG: hypothetical protein EXR83_06280 [Gammaproteobacteria bacterium]|nr:hypothetical protein [Gammaproteobacteria bacterium]